jgi:hypothetical protein
MSKFRVKMKLQGFELEIEGNSREEASVIGQNIGKQVSGILQPGMRIVGGEVANEAPPVFAPGVLLDDLSKKRGRRRSKSQINGSERSGSDEIHFRHDPEKFGSPNQQWTTSQKAIWLLYVVKEVAQISELSTGQIVKLFNTHFRQAKTVTNSNVSRDLGKLKIASPSQVGEDNSKNPARWFLTDEGIRQAQSLIAELLTPRTA